MLAESLHTVYTYGSSSSSSSSSILILILIWRAQLGESYQLLGELSKQLDELG